MQSPGPLKRNAPTDSSLPCRHGKMTTDYTHVPLLTVKPLSVLNLAFVLSVMHSCQKQLLCMTMMLNISDQQKQLNIEA
ncbi:hypothetical protein PBY51_010412 [Eleginops maclovinus]|uniref:Uncharacterized protein n=1 Tax=Eleginops maclovinus TaxID=56733 RepID=A0AAN7X6F7_ELEMC|nr:hypothetical protein PBY51_010412 [Eleginops maclovinus]